MDETRAVYAQIAGGNHQKSEAHTFGTHAETLHSVLQRLRDALCDLEQARERCQRALQLAERLADGGWNCQTENGSVRSSFDTTINVLDGLLEFERATGGSAEVRTARRSGEEYLLERGLFRRKSTGAVVQPAYLEFAFPYYWHYDVLRALDYFRWSGSDPDPRMAEAVAVVQSKRQPDGRWLLDRIHPGRVHFDLEGGAGTPSRWNTLRALRVLKWWDGIA